MATNIWNEDLENIYIRNENHNALGGYYPIGDGGTWHSGIHIYSDTPDVIMPYLGGTLVAYRLNKDFIEVPKKHDISKTEYESLLSEEKKFYRDYNFTEDPISKINGRKILNDEETKEKISNNFFIIKHSFFNNKFVFYSLYNNILPDNIYYADYLDFKDYDNSIWNKHLLFYKTWKFRVNIDDTCSEKSFIQGKKVFNRDYLTGNVENENSSYNVFREKINSSTNINLISCTTDLEKTKFSINSTNIDIDSIKIKFSKSNLLLCESDKLYTATNSERNYNMVGDYSNTISINKSQLQETELHVTLKGENFANDKDYLNVSVLLPYSFLSTNKQGCDTLYSKRYESTACRIFRIGDNKDITITNENCPLFYEDLTKDDSLLLQNGIVRISGYTLRSLFNFKNNKIITLIKNSEVPEIITNIDFIDSEVSNTETINLNDDDYIYFYKESSAKENIKFFIAGKYHEPIDISTINDNEFQTKLNELLSKEEEKIFEKLPEVSSKVAILKTEPISVYAMDCYEETLSVYNSQEAYKSIKNNKIYIFCKLYIQSTSSRKYKVDNNIEVVSVAGYTNGNPEFPIQGILLYDNLTEKHPKKFFDSSFEFTTNNTITESTSSHLSFSSVHYENSIYALKVASNLLEVKIDDNNEYNLDFTGGIKCPNIPINQNNILGITYNENKYKIEKPFYDISVFLEKNYMEDHNLEKMEKKYYIYSDLPTGHSYYKDCGCNSYDFFLPKQSKLSSFSEKTEGKEKVFSFKINHIAIYIRNNFLDLYFDQIELKKDFDLSQIYITKGNTKTSINKREDAKLLQKDLSSKKLYKTESNDDKYCKVLLTSEEINFPKNLYVINDSFFKNHSETRKVNKYIITTNKDYENFLYYNRDPRTANGKAILNYIYLPKGTTLEIIQTIQLGGTICKRLQILALPIYISKNIIIKKCKIKNKPESIILFDGNSHTYKEGAKDKIPSNFFKNINKIINVPFEYGEISGNWYNVFIPSNKIELDNEWYIKNEEKYNRLKNYNEITTKNETFTAFEKNPLFIYPEELKATENKKIDTIIDNNPKRQKSAVTYYPVKFKGDENNYYLIKGSVDKYRKNAFDWKEFFVNCQKENDTDIFCDLKTFSNSYNFNDAEKKLIKNIFDDEEVENELQELYSSKVNKNITELFHKLVVTHVHELDKKAYENVKETADIKYIKDRCAKVEICNAVLAETEFQNVNKNNGMLTFVHPVYFLNHLKKANIFEFNPYEGLPPRAPRFWPEQRSIDFIDNPGFVPYRTKTLEGKYLDNDLHQGNIYYPEINVGFNVRTDNSYDVHMGVDFPGEKGDRIKSLIHGVVWACTYDKTIKEGSNAGCGRIMIIKGDDDLMYLLCHLSGYLKEPGDEVFPNDDVALLGHTGYSTAPHLHLEVYKTNVVGCSEKYKDKILNDKDDTGKVIYNQKDPNDTISNGLTWVKTYKKLRVNPFYHGEKYVKD